MSATLSKSGMKLVYRSAFFVKNPATGERVKRGETFPAQVWERMSVDKRARWLRDGFVEWVPNE